MAPVHAGPPRAGTAPGTGAPETARNAPSAGPCNQAETGQPEVALLSAVLQTANQMARREMYQRELVLPRDGQRVADAFVALVTETQLELEKRVLRGELVDQSLLQMLRVISLEAGEYASDE